MIRIWFEDTYNPGWYWEEGNEKFGPFFSAESAIKDYRKAGKRPLSFRGGDECRT
jgi:hypothetical protein